jgi:low temperature requirement protein LtrA
VNEDGPGIPPRIAPAHHLQRMSGRDPHEDHRTATPLELLFDLTFVVAFGVAASEFAHLLAEGHVAAGLAGFSFSAFAVSWAWINFTWFASAYDTDDWAYRVTTMMQMVGVIILALGIPPVYASIAEGGHVDNRVMIAGYVVMRIAMVVQWLRAARQDPQRRTTCLTYAAAITVAQIGWVGAFAVHTSVPVTFGLYAVLILIEFLGPWIAERFQGRTPWHPHHIAERYSLLVIIALGEGVVGTVASLSAVIAGQGWSVSAAMVAVAGTGLTFGMWWVYFMIPAAPLLHAYRHKSFTFGYGHIPIFGAIVATGAGLHAAAYYIEHHSELGSVETVLSVAIPVGVYLLCIFALYTYLVERLDTFHILLAGASVTVLVAAVLLAAAGVTMAVCLLVVMLAPIVVVIGYESVGHRHAEHVIGAALSREL